jgi:hypothetical protein
MGTVLALVIPSSNRQRFEEIARTLSGITLRWVLYQRESEIRDNVNALLSSEHVDAVFLGPMPHDRCRDLLPAGLPVEVMRMDAADLAVTFARAIASGWSPAPVSIDTFDEQVVHEVGQALDLAPAHTGCLPYDSTQSVADIVQFHREFIARSGGGYVVTGRTEVARRLRGELPLLRVMALPSTIRAGLHQLALRAQSKRDSELRFAAAIFRVVFNGSSRGAEGVRLTLRHMLLNTPEFADAWVEDRGRRGIVVFAHKALLEKVTGGWVAFPMIAPVEARLGFRVAAGFGLGSSARTCVLLAEHAAARAEQEGGGCAYLMGDHGLIVGPIARDTRRLEFTYREHGGELEGLAREVGLSPVTLSRLAAVDRRLESRPISPAELADALGITDPSGRRLVRTLAEHGLAVPAGTAQPSYKGRPSHLYRLRIEQRLRGGGEADRERISTLETTEGAR